MNRPWKIVLVLLGIFIAGGVAGWFTARGTQEPEPRRRSPEQWISARLKMMQERLELTTEQEQRIRPIMDRESDELGRLREQSFRDTRAVLDRMEKEIAAVLTPEQQVKFTELNNEIRERTRKSMERRKQHDKQRRDPPPKK